MAFSFFSVFRVTINYRKVFGSYQYLLPPRQGGAITNTLSYVHIHFCCSFNRIWLLYEMSEPDQSHQIENSPAEDGSHSHLLSTSPNGHPFRVPGRRTRTTSEYVFFLLMCCLMHLNKAVSHRSFAVFCCFGYLRDAQL